tara:strand:- start:3843 stop:4151 length:309 start_codon:yes stop_codon:yes gene_type:complete
MNIKKLDSRSKLFYFGFTYRIEDSIYNRNKLLPATLKQLAGKDDDKYVFFNCTDSLTRMQSCRFTSKRLYNGEVAHHYDARKKCEVHYIKHESTLALLKLIL